MKKLLFLLSAVLMATLAFSGLALAQEEAKKEEAKKEFKVAYIARAQGDSFAAWLANAVKEEAEKNYPNIKITVFDGQSNNETIASHIENAVTSGFDAILLQPFDPEAQVAPMNEAADKGLVTATVNLRINDSDRAAAVDADPFAQAAVNAKLALEQIPQNANVVVLNGPAGNTHALERRRAWQEEFFAKRPDVKIVGEQIANWNKDEAMKYMEDWIQASNGDIKAIISMNDNMATGAIEAAEAAKIEGILSYGVDGTAEACLFIKEGRMTATSLQSAYDLAAAALKQINTMLTEKAPRQTVMIDCPLITKDNVDQFIEMHKKAGHL